MHAEFHLWGGRTFSADEGFRQICSYPSTGNKCGVGGFAFGSGYLFDIGAGVSAGLDWAYLPTSWGTIRLSDTITMNIDSSYIPVMAQARYSLGSFFIGAGSGYAFIAERPRIFGSSIPDVSSPPGIYAAMLELGYVIAADENVSFFGSVKTYGLYPSGSPTYIFVPSIGFFLRL